MPQSFYNTNSVATAFHLWEFCQAGFEKDAPSDIRQAYIKIILPDHPFPPPDARLDPSSFTRQGKRANKLPPPGRTPSNVLSTDKRHKQLSARHHEKEKDTYSLHLRCGSILRSLLSNAKAVPIDCFSLSQFSCQSSTFDCILRLLHLNALFKIDTLYAPP